MWHTLAYSGSIASAQTAHNLPAVIEQALPVGPSNGYRLMEPMYLASAWSSPINGQSFYLTSPKFSSFSPFQVIPLGGIGALADGLLVASWPYRAPSFRSQEEVVASVDTGGTAAAVETLIASLATSVDAPPPGEELELRFTLGGATVANTWTLMGQPVFSFVLPEGAYVLLSSELFGSSAVAHRWIFSGQFYRPGFPSVASQAYHQWPGVRDYRMGVAGTFSNVTLPQIEVFDVAASAVSFGIMRVIKVA